MSEGGWFRKYLICFVIIVGFLDLKVREGFVMKGCMYWYRNGYRCQDSASVPLTPPFSIFAVRDPN